MISTPDRKQILDSLEPLFRRAEEHGLWFHTTYQDIWFSPKQLRAEHAKGCFVWGACNWTLRNPQEKVQEAENRWHSAKASLERVRKEVEGT